jgi:hypothetical protein
MREEIEAALYLIFNSEDPRHGHKELQGIDLTADERRELDNRFQVHARNNVFQEAAGLLQKAVDLYLACEIDPENLKGTLEYFIEVAKNEPH